MELKVEQKAALQIIQEQQSPVFVYNEQIIQKRCSELLAGLKQFPTKTKALYACKANTNPNILKTILNSGVKGIDTVSVGECMLAVQTGFAKEDILYTENYMSKEELQYAVDNDILINVGELSTLEKIGQQFPNKSVAIRINPDIGSGEHSHVITGGSESKFGIYFTQFDEILKIVEKYNLKIIGLHQHIGSNICQGDLENYVNSAKCIFETALHFKKDLKFINIGGGIGVPYKPSDNSLDLNEAFKQVSELYTKVYRQNADQDIEIWVEPGRFLVAESGTLLCTATAVKTNPFYTYIGTDTGMNHLIRPAFYDSYHHINNVSNYNNWDKKMIATICGNICESSDIFGKNREIEYTQEGDILAIQNAGAYCFSMANNYNSRLKPPEVIIRQNGETQIIRRRETYQDLQQTTLLI